MESNSFDYESTDIRYAEVKALKEIYKEEFQELRKLEYFTPYSFNIQLDIEDTNKKLHMVLLNFVLSVTYPNRVAKVKIVKDFNLTSKQKEGLEKVLLQVSIDNKENQMVHEMILAAKEYLHKINLTEEKTKTCEESELFIQENLQTRIEHEIRKKSIKIDLNETIERDNTTVLEGIFNSFSLESPKKNDESSEDYDPDEIAGEHFLTDENATKKKSRYENDFEEISKIGIGGFGVVHKVRNRLDGLYYAIKQIVVKNNKNSTLFRILREVKAIARLTHSNVVRYYQAWIEKVSYTGFADCGEGDSTKEFFEALDIDCSYSDEYYDDDENSYDKKKKQEKETEQKEVFVLFIQMEYCKGKTLRELIDSETLTKESIWKLFIQIFEVVNYIHSKSTIHRDIKPTNIFMDGKNNIKLGDFGLALLSQGRSAASGEVKLECNDKAGTPFYKSPEQSEKTSSLTEKVDIYPIGIILIEMCCSFKTAMERNLTLKEIKETGMNKEIKETIDKKTSFESRGKLFRMSRLIESLIQSDPDLRPGTVKDLLLAGLIPLEIVDNSFDIALNELSTKGSSFRNKALKQLFSAQAPDYLQYTYDSLVSERINSDIKRTLSMWEIKSKLCNKMRKIFEKHGMTELETPLLFPCTRRLKSAVTLLDVEGNIVTLPYSHFVSFARFVSLNEIKSLERYCFSRVFREQVSGSQPRHILECHYDLVFPASQSKSWKNAKMSEGVCILSEIFLALNLYLENRSISYFFSSAEVLGVILNSCCEKFSVPMASLMPEKVYSFLLKHVSVSSRQLKNFLTKETNLDSKCVNYLVSHLIIDGSYHDVINRFVDEFGEKLNVLKEIEQLMNMIEFFMDEKHTIEFKPSLVLSKEIFGSLIFMAVSNKGETMASGGCIDQAIEKCLSPKQRNATTFSNSSSCFSVNIQLEKIMNIASTEGNKSLKSNRERKDSVLILSLNNSFLKEKIQLAKVFWKSGIKTQYLHREFNSINNAITYCKEAGLKWIVFLRKSEMLGGFVRLYKVFPKVHKTSVMYSEVISAFRKQESLMSKGRKSFFPSFGNPEFETGFQASQAALQSSSPCANHSHASSHGIQRVSHKDSSGFGTTDEGSAESLRRSKIPTHGLSVDRIKLVLKNEVKDFVKSKFVYSAIECFEKHINNNSDLKSTLIAAELPLILIKKVTNVFKFESQNKEEEINKLKSENSKHSMVLSKLSVMLERELKAKPDLVFVYSTRDLDFDLCKF